MRLLHLLLAMLVTTAVAGAAQPPQVDSKPALERLKANPNDSAALNQYLGDNLRRVIASMDTDAKAAEQTLKDMKQVLETLQPEAEPAKRALAQAKNLIGVYEQQVEMARTPLEEVEKQLKAKPDDPKIISMYAAKVQRQISPILRTDPNKAEAILKAAKELLGKVQGEAKSEAAKQAFTRADQGLARMQSSIDSIKRLNSLVGQNAAPLKVESWVNGTPLTDADLKGKVVLLDFWAVWCGPCIATFPHLREWQEKYADKGLTIVGLTRYYGYTWDQATSRATRPAPKPRPQAAPNAKPAVAPAAEPVAKPTPAEEQEMLKKFAEHHKLQHRFAIQTDNSLAEYYAVTGIPHVVVIDQTGKIRLIRVGSGEQNAKDVEAMIVSLLGGAAK